MFVAKCAFYKQNEKNQINMDDLVTIDAIIDWLRVQVETKNPIDPHTWVDALLKCTIFMPDEHSKLFELEQKVAQMKVLNLQEGMTASAAKMFVEATDEYKTARNQKARIQVIEELVRLGKVQARLADTGIRLS